MSGAIRCPHCQKLLFSIDLPEPSVASTTTRPDKPLLLRVAEAARLLGVSRSALYELIAAGQLPVMRLGRSVRVIRRDLEAWVAREKD